MSVTLSRRLAYEIVNKGVSVNDVTEVLKTYKLLSLLPSILKAVSQLHSVNVLQETILIESPFTLSPKALARIKRIVGNDIADHELTISKKLLSGFRARFRGKLYDVSAERIIRQLVDSK